MNLSFFRSNQQQPQPSNGGTLLFFLGGICVVFGVLIVVYPDLLQIFVASVLITVGLGLIGFAWKLRQITKQTRSMFDSFFHRGE